MASTNLIIVGASVRAAAFSALRAGLQPVCFDVFADADLQGRCSAVAVDSQKYPFNLPKALALAPPGPWMYTGAIENYPKLVERIASSRPLWGNDAQSLRRARDPFHVAKLLRDANLPAPLVRRPGETEKSSRRWLTKPLAGAGGTGIGFWKPQEARRQRTYLQEYIEGESVAAIFVADAGRADLLGVTRQLVGQTWLHARPFAYCGSIGPITLTDEVRNCFQQIGQVLAQGCRLHGLFGVDAIVRDNAVFAVEVNPRYTASIEVLEYATGVQAMDRNRKAFEATSAATIGNRSNQTGDAVNKRATVRPLSPRLSGGEGVTRGARHVKNSRCNAADQVVGKAIYFASKSLCFPEDGPWGRTLRVRESLADAPEFADIPAGSSRISASGPVLTFFVQGPTIQDCCERLQQRAAELDRLLCRS